MNEHAMKAFTDKLRELYEDRLCGGLDGDAWDDAVDSALDWVTRESLNIRSVTVDFPVKALEDDA